MARSSTTMMAAAAGTGHVRSASLPCQSHPLLTQVEDQLLALRSWTSNPGQNPLSLAHVRALLCVLDELLLHLHLPPTRACSCSCSCCCCAHDGPPLVDGFLVLADAFGSFLSALLALRQHAAELRAAVRRRDAAKVASAARAQRQVGRELEHLAAAVARDAAKCARATSNASSDLLDDVVVRTVTDAINGTAAASASVFLEVGALADAALALASPAESSSASRKQKHRLASGRTKQRRSGEEQPQPVLALEKLRELEQCIGELETETEKVFRSLVQTRVSLLNIYTPSFY